MASRQHTESLSPPDPSRTNFRELLHMSVNNPYAHAWLGRNNSDQLPVVPPSIFGALPFAAPSEQSPLLAFQFAALNPDILNCIVLGPNARHCFSIATASPTFGQPAVTIIRNDKNEVVGKVEWHQQPIVEIKDMVPRCSVSQFLPLSQDMSYRTMTVKGRSYAWTCHNSAIRLYNTAYNPAEMLGALSRGQSAISLNVAATAIHHGMLDVCALVAVLLYSGRNID